MRPRGRLSRRRSRRRSPGPDARRRSWSTVPGQEPVAFDLVAGADVPRGGLLTRINAAARADPRQGAQLPARPLSRRMAGRRFISFEGIDGSGKSDPGPGCSRPRCAPRGAEVVETREPGGAPGAEAIRRAARRGRPRPLVARDRDPALHRRAARPPRAHHPPGAGPRRHRGHRPLRRLDPRLPGRRPRRPARRPSMRCTRSRSALEPDLTLILDLDPATALHRGLARGGAEDRFERLGRGFQARLRAGFLALAAEFPDRCRLIVRAAGTAEEVAAPRRRGGRPHERAAGARPPARRAASARDRRALRPGRRRGAVPRTPPPRAGCTTPGSSPGRAASARRRSPGASPATSSPAARPQASRWRPRTRSSARLAALASPQLFLCRRPWDDKAERLRTAITVDEVRALKSFFQLSAADGGWRVAIVDAADEMTGSAANALLKILEEPPSAAGAPARLPPAGGAPADDPLALPRAALAPARGGRPRRRARRRRRRDRQRRAALATLAGGSVGAAWRLAAERRGRALRRDRRAPARGAPLDRRAAVALAESAGGRDAARATTSSSSSSRIALSRLALAGAGAAGRALSERRGRGDGPPRRHPGAGRGSGPSPRPGSPRAPRMRARSTLTPPR